MQYAVQPYILHPAKLRYQLMWWCVGVLARFYLAFYLQHARVTLLVTIILVTRIPRPPPLPASPSMLCPRRRPGPMSWYRSLCSVHDELRSAHPAPAPRWSAGCRRWRRDHDNVAAWRNSSGRDRPPRSRPVYSSAGVRHRARSIRLACRHGAKLGSQCSHGAAASHSHARALETESPRQPAHSAAPPRAPHAPRATPPRSKPQPAGPSVTAEVATHSSSGGLHEPPWNSGGPHSAPKGRARASRCA